MLSWASPAESLADPVIQSIHQGLPVELIMTPRSELLTCMPEELISEVMARNDGPYSFIPVVGGDRVCGLFHAHPYFSQVDDESGVVEDFAEPLSEKHLIGANASIIDFVLCADETPCRMVVTGHRIEGLVSISDLQRLPVRIALFSLITGLEILMTQKIRKVYSSDQKWMPLLNEHRQTVLNEQIAMTRSSDAYVDDLLFTQFADKALILKKGCGLEWSKSKLEKAFRRVQKLRNSLAHANVYAHTPEAAKDVSATARTILELRDILVS